MIIFPAIDLFGGQAVRLYKGDYNQMTVYDIEPVRTVCKFEEAGATWLHIVDLEGAKTGETTNLPTIRAITNNTGLSFQVGGGIRSLETVQLYLDAGASRVILGTAAVRDPEFLEAAVKAYGDKIAVGVDIKDGFVAVSGWTETTALTCDEFCRGLEALGVSTIICTDISKDGVMKGTNRELYRHLAETYSLQIVASGGVSTLEDIAALREIGLYGAIVGTAYYSGAIDLAQAIQVAKGALP